MISLFNGRKTTKRSYLKKKVSNSYDIFHFNKDIRFKSILLHNRTQPSANMKFN